MGDSWAWVFSGRRENGGQSAFLHKRMACSALCWFSMQRSAAYSPPAAEAASTSDDRCEAACNLKQKSAHPECVQLYHKGFTKLRLRRRPQSTRALRARRVPKGPFRGRRSRKGSKGPFGPRGPFGPGGWSPFGGFAFHLCEENTKSHDVRCFVFGSPGGKDSQVSDGKKQATKLSAASNNKAAEKIMLSGGAKPPEPCNWTLWRSRT